MTPTVLLTAVLTIVAACILCFLKRETYIQDKSVSFLRDLMPKEHTVTIQKGMGAKSGKAFCVAKSFGAVMDRAIVQFQIRFAQDFDFGCKGKIGGFHIGPGASSGEKHSVNGSSFRVMWNKDKGAYMYIYVPLGSENMQIVPALRNRHVNGQGGHELFNGSGFPNAFAGLGWHTVNMGIVLNSFKRDGTPNADGVLYLNIDGHARWVNKVIMRLKPSFKATNFKFCLFHGGPCVATKDMHASLRHCKLFAW